MNLTEHLQLIQSSPSARELEKRFQETLRLYRWRTQGRIIRAVQRRGAELVAASPAGFYVPQLGRRRRMWLCGEEYSVGYGQNSTGERYSWEYAKQWALSTMRKHKVPPATAKHIMDWWGHYPHRALQYAERWYKRRKGAA